MENELARAEDRNRGEEALHAMEGRPVRPDVALNRMGTA
jgi:hypothetical protein